MLDAQLLARARRRDVSEHATRDAKRVRIRRLRFIPLRLLATEEELASLFGGTAKRVYKIGEYAPEPEE